MELLFNDLRWTVGQLLGFGALITVIFSYWQKKKSLMIALQILANLFFAIHYYMLVQYSETALSGAVSSLVQVGVFILCALRDKYDWSKILSSIPIIVAFVLIGIFTYKTPLSLLPIIASLISLLSFLQHNKVIIKITGIISPSIWLIYVIAISSYSGVITEIILIVFTALSLLKKTDDDKQNN